MRAMGRRRREPSCRPREGGDPYAAARRYGTAFNDKKLRWLWVPAFAGTTPRNTNHSSAVSRLALPPAAAVLMVTTCSVTKRRRVLGLPAFGPVPESPVPPNGWVPTTAPIMLRLT